MLAVHISNRYIDLVPVCARGAEHVGREGKVVRSVSDGMFDSSIWVLITSNHVLLAQPQFQTASVYTAQADPAFVGWTDQYSSVWPLLNLSGKAHALLSR